MSKRTARPEAARATRVGQAEKWEKRRKMLIERLYHEDILLARRTSNFVGIQGFLAAALTVSISRTEGSGIEDFLIAYLVMLFGLGLSLFYIPLGLRSCWAILFWREWLRRVESELEFKLDSALHESYEKGSYETSVGTICSSDRRMRPMRQVFPWVFPWFGSTNLWFGVWLPALIAFFWVLALVALPARPFIPLVVGAVPMHLLRSLLAGPLPPYQLSVLTVLFIVVMIALLQVNRRFVPGNPTPRKGRAERSKMDCERAEQFAVRVTEEAGKLLWKHFGSSDSRVKDDGSLQITAEVKAEALIRNRVMSTFPQTSFLAEESNELPDTRGFLWVCDPLDGTTNFVNRQPIWAVSIALLEDLRPLIGVVHIPFLEETISAVRGGGTLCNGERVKTRATDGKQFSDIYTFCSWQSNKFSSNLPGNIRAFGSTAYHVAQFACGRTAGGWEMGARIWDIAAGILLVQEAGGIIRFVDGGDPIDVLREMHDIRGQTVPCIFAANAAVYELMQEDMAVTRTG